MGESRPAPASARPGSGGWHWLLSLVAIVTVALLSLGMAFLTRNVEERPVWMMGLIFMVPAAALMLAAMVVEGVTSAMTPGSSRGPQIRLAIIATLATFAVGVICDLIYLQGFKKELPPAQSAVTAYEEADRMILVVDTTASMEGEAHAQAASAVRALMDGADGAWEAGMVAASQKQTKTAALAPLSEEQKNDLIALADQTPDQGRLYYADALEAALDMAEGAGISADRSTRVIFLTDGVHPWSAAGDKDLMDRCVRDHAVISCVLLGPEAEHTLRSYIEETGGSIVGVDQALSLLAGMLSPRFTEEVKAAEVPENEKLSLDLIRNGDPSAKIITFVMLLLEGLSLGVCLSLMLSVSGQFRAQYIISPLMGVTAFVLLKLIWNYDADWNGWWVKEGLSFSLLGVVVMMRNHGAGKTLPGPAAPAQDFGDQGFW